MLNNREYMKYIFNVKRAFTLLEIIIVIIIIGILMAATMRFGGGRVSFLNNKNVKEQFVSNYDQLYSDNMLSSYHLGEIYTTLNIDFVSWSSWFDYTYIKHDGSEISTDFSMIEAGSYFIKKIEVWGHERDELNIEFIPYVLGCVINDETDETNETANIEVIANSDKSYCFEIDSNNCRLDRISCE